jgi:tetratricopeptide (TPR) repeat protein
MIKAHRWYRLGDTVMLSATAMALALIVTHAPAQTWKDLKCTGDSDIPWSEQITGCSNAITSGTFAGKDLAVAFQRRGTAYASTADFDHALVDYDQAIQIDPNSARALVGRGAVRFLKTDYDHAIADFTAAIGLDPNYAVAFNNRGKRTR